MLKIKRKKFRSIKTVMPGFISADPMEVAKDVRAILGSPNPARALQQIKPTKLFIRAKLSGATNVEAKALSGVPDNKDVTTLLTTPIAKLLLTEVLESDTSFSDEGIAKRLREMWDCSDDVYVPNGNGGVMKRKRKNWDVRKFAFTNVLELRGYKDKKDESGKNSQVTQIIFNETPIPGNPKVIEVKAENG